MLDALLSDLAQAWRSARSAPRLTIFAILTLAVAVGAATGLFTVVHAVILQPLPYAHQDRLVLVWQRDEVRGQPILEVSHRDYVDWRARARTFEDLAAMGSVNWSLQVLLGDQRRTLSNAAVSASFFSVLGVPPALGRTFHPEEDQRGGGHVVVLSHRLWRELGADETLVGRTLPVRAGERWVPIEVIGVMPPAFDYPRGAEVWTPLAPAIDGASAAIGSDALEDRGFMLLYAIGRLRDGVSLDGARRDVEAVIRQIHPDLSADARLAVVTPVLEHLLGPTRPVLWTLLGGVVLMLVIAAVNIGGLQLARAGRRRQDAAIRLAVGAAPQRLVRVSLIESAMLATAASVGGYVLALVCRRWLIALAPYDVPRIHEASLVDWRVFAFSVLAAGAVVTLSGIWPAVAAARIQVLDAMGGHARASAGIAARRGQRVLITFEVALALVLLVAAGLLMRTAANLRAIDLGFEPQGLVTLGVSPDTEDLDRWNAYYAALIERAGRLPGVAAVGGAYARPLAGPIGFDTIPRLEGVAEDDLTAWQNTPMTNLLTVTPGYFPAMGIHLVRGRTFTDADTQTSPGVVVVSESAARRLWPGRDAIGQRLRDVSYRPAGDPETKAWQTVVGIVADVRHRGLTDGRLDMYVPASQSRERVQHLMLRTTGGAGVVTRAIAADAKALDRGAVVWGETTMERAVEEALATSRFTTRVFAAFAAVAVLLATIGLAALMAFAVGQRQRELAIRASVGATPARLVSHVVGEAVRVICVGLALGLALALASGGLLRSLLYEVAPTDPAALAASASLLTAVGVIAMWLPARRASRLDAAELLRQP